MAGAGEPLVPVPTTVQLEYDAENLAFSLSWEWAGADPDYFTIWYRTVLTDPYEELAPEWDGSLRVVTYEGVPHHPPSDLVTMQMEIRAVVGGNASAWVESNAADNTVL
jgi:hypothetical protein